jgi:hypothetical protein
VLTKDEWKKNVEIAAAHKHGEDNASFYVWRRRLAGPWGVVLAVVAFGLVVRWLTHHVHLPSASGGPAGLPVLFWILLVGLILGTGWSFRPARTIRPAATTLIRAFVIGLLWLGFVTYAITVII